MIQTQSGVNRINDNAGSQSHHSNAIIHTTGRVESSLLFKYPCNKLFRTTPASCAKEKIDGTKELLEEGKDQ